jgi:Ca2+-binding EF-hand superfamily protein
VTDIANELVSATANELVATANGLVTATANELVSATKTLGDMLSFKKPGKKPKPKMLTSAQISDLFRRLDRDGNGELDLEEFLQVSKKLKLEATEEYMTG